MLIIYVLFISFLGVYGFHRYLLLRLFYRHHLARPPEPELFAELPIITVQLPLYNEYHVVDRLLDAVGAFDYPRERFEIQVLDDSTDDCTEIVRACCERFQADGIDIVCHHRDAREGFKSGALAAGLLYAQDGRAVGVGSLAHSQLTAYRM